MTARRLARVRIDHLVLRRSDLDAADVHELRVALGRALSAAAAARQPAADPAARPDPCDPGAIAAVLATRILGEVEP